jgi:hypothetical protein
MTKLFPLAIAALSLAMLSPATAFYTECTAAQDTTLAIRPDGPSEPRFMPVNKGDKVAFRANHKNWWFVLHYWKDGEASGADYGWLPRAILVNCQRQEGTP